MTDGSHAGDEADGSTKRPTGAAITSDLTPRRQP